MINPGQIRTSPPHATVGGIARRELVLSVTHSLLSVMASGGHGWEPLQRMSARAYRRALLLALLTVSGLALPGATLAGALAPRTLYVDCSAAKNGPGTATRPMNSVQAANNLTLGPGDHLRFRRGTAC